MLLVRVAAYFVMTVVVVVLPWWVVIDWWWGENTVDVDTVVIIAGVSWFFGFRDWLKSE